MADAVYYGWRIGLTDVDLLGDFAVVGVLERYPMITGTEVVERNVVAESS